MTIIFVMLGEVLIFLPSIANFRIQWLKGRIAQAEIAALAAEAAPDRILSSDLRTEILKGAGVLVVSLTRGDMRQLMLRSDTDHMIDASYDLRQVQWLPAIVDAFSVMIGTDERVIGVIDRPPNMSGDMIEVALVRSAAAPGDDRLWHQHPDPVGDPLGDRGGTGLRGAERRAGAADQAAHQQHGGLRQEPGRPLAHHRALEPADEIGLAERELHDMQSELSSCCSRRAGLRRWAWPSPRSAMTCATCSPPRM